MQCLVAFHLYCHLHLTHTSRLETIVLSRFLFNLRRTAVRLTINHRTKNNTLSEVSNTASSPSELRFNSHVLEDLGGSLSFHSDDDDIEVAEVPEDILEQTGSDIVVLESS